MGGRATWGGGETRVETVCACMRCVRACVCVCVHTVVCVRWGVLFDGVRCVHMCVDMCVWENVCVYVGVCRLCGQGFESRARVGKKKTFEYLSERGNSCGKHFTECSQLDSQRQQATPTPTEREREGGGKMDVVVVVFVVVVSVFARTCVCVCVCV